VGADLFHANGQTDESTDMMKLTIPFQNSVNAPIKTKIYVEVNKDYGKWNEKTNDEISKHMTEE
jgi:hypothetical protein